MTAAFAERLLGWYDREQRDLPWRTTRDPWAIWVSEIMLQQTRVEVVAQVYSTFMRRFPRPRDFAAVTDEDLLLAWRGLGYYRRARLLRAGARQVVDDYSGSVPTSAAELGRLAGIGAYTRGAIASIAFDEVVPAIDGNVERVVARHRGIRSLIKHSTARRQVVAFVETHLDGHRPGDFNQALMDLGATVCKPRAVRCEVCPVREDCVALADGLVDQLPLTAPRRSSIELTARALVCESGDGLLARRIPAGEINEGQIELPGPGTLQACSNALDLTDFLHERYGRRFEIGPELARVQHSITHHRITLIAHAGQYPSSPSNGLIVASANDPNAAWTTASRKVFAKLEQS